MATKTTPNTQTTTTGATRLPPIQGRAAILSRLRQVNTSTPVDKVKTLATRQGTGSGAAASQTSVARPTLTKASTTKKSTGYNSNDYGRCKGCNREIKKDTLTRNGGDFCGNCKRSKDGTGKPNKRKTTKNCEGCEQPFSLATLTKYKHEGKETNRCKKCHDKFVADQTGRNSGQTSSCCLACEKPTSGGVSKDFSGFCYPCAVALMEVYYLDQMAVFIQKAIDSGEVEGVVGGEVGEEGGEVGGEEGGEEGGEVGGEGESED